MIPATIGVAAFQFNIIITQTLAFWIERSTGSKIVASFEYCTVDGTAAGCVRGVLGDLSFTDLSRLGRREKISRVSSAGDGLSVFVNAIAAAMLIVLAEPMVRLLFERRGVHGRLD